jgi:sulfur carrier protein ThiS
VMLFEEVELDEPDDVELVEVVVGAVLLEV